MPLSTKMARAKAEAVYWDNYVKYLETVDERGSGVGQGKPRPEMTILHVAPFALDMNITTDLVKTSANAVTWSAQKAKWTIAGVSYARDDWGDTAEENSINIKYRVARVSITTGISATGTKKIAKGTKKPYLSYGGTSSSIPFGRALGASGAGANPTENAVFSLLLNQFLVNGKIPTGMKITHVKEKG